LSSKIQDLIDILPIPKINILNQRILYFKEIEKNSFEIEFGEMILGPYPFDGDIKEFIQIYFTQIAKTNNFEDINIAKNMDIVNSKNNNSYNYMITDINFILNLV